MSVLAALKKFGLIVESNGRMVPTQRAIEIVNLKENDPRRIQALKEAALEPAIYRELIDQHRETGWPSDDVLESELITYRNFNPNAVAGFVKDLKDTLDYAGISQENGLSSNKDEEAGSEWVRPKIGDFVQWESLGVLQFQEPKCIQSFSEDGSYAFVEGSKTGLPVKDLIVVERPEALGNTPVLSTPLRAQTGAPAKTLSGHMRQDVFSLTEGAVTVQWPTPLSAESIKDLQDWLEIIKRKIARSVATSAEPAMAE